MRQPFAHRKSITVGDLAIGRILTKWESCVTWECARHNNIIHMRVRRSNSMYDQLKGLPELCNNWEMGVVMCRGVVRCRKVAKW